MIVKHKEDADVVEAARILQEVQVTRQLFSSSKYNYLFFVLLGRDLRLDGQERKNRVHLIPDEDHDQKARLRPIDHYQQKDQH